MTSFIAGFVVVVALCATHTADARKHHRGAKQVAPVAMTKSGVVPVETKRDPADIALDSKIKGICRGC